MARTYRRRQFTVEPGQARDVGTFRDAAGSPIVVAVAVQGCDDEARTAAAATRKGPARWEVDLPPDTSVELDGLEDEDGTELRLKLVAGPCPGAAGSDENEIVEGGSPVDIDAIDLVAEVEFDPDIAAESDDF